MSLSKKKIFGSETTQCFLSFEDKNVSQRAWGVCRKLSLGGAYMMEKKFKQKSFRKIRLSQEYLHLQTGFNWSQRRSFELEKPSKVRQPYNYQNQVDDVEELMNAFAKMNISSDETCRLKNQGNKTLNQPTKTVAKKRSFEELSDTPNNAKSQKSW